MSTATPVSYRGKVYASGIDVARAVGCDPNTVYNHLRKYGHLEHLGETKLRSPHMRRKPLRVGPLTFSSRLEAARILGVHRREVFRACAGDATAKQKLLAAAMRHVAEADRGAA